MKGAAVQEIGCFYGRRGGFRERLGEMWDFIHIFVVGKSVVNLMRVLAICVVYQPDPELLLRSVASYADAVDKVLIWQNSQLPDTLKADLLKLAGDPEVLDKEDSGEGVILRRDGLEFEERKECKAGVAMQDGLKSRENGEQGEDGRESRIVFRGDESNAGIAVALNAAWQEAVAGGYDAVLTMDQDSVWKAFGDFLEAIESPDAPDGFYAPRILSNPGIEDREVSGKDVVVGKNTVSSTSTTMVFAPFDTAFTSGMLIPIQVIEKVGGWSEDFRVDGIDNEFCLHARSLGIQGYRVSSGWLEHALGKVVVKRLFGLRFRTYNYTPDRLFGIYRNNLIAIKKYPSVSKNFRREFYRTWLWRRPLRMLLGERNLKEKLGAICRGIRAARKAEI